MIMLWLARIASRSSRQCMHCLLFCGCAVARFAALKIAIRSVHAAAHCDELARVFTDVVAEGKDCRWPARFTLRALIDPHALRPLHCQAAYAAALVLPLAVKDRRCV